VRRAEADYDVAQRDYNDKAQRLTAEHPDLIMARSKSKQAESSLQHVARSRADPAPPTAKGAGQQRPGRRRWSDRWLRLRRRAAAGGMSRRQLEVTVMFESLRHELEQARGRLAGMEDKQFQAGLAAKLETSSEIGQLAILDPASRPGLPLIDVRKKVAIAGHLPGPAAGGGRGGPARPQR
jgi:hypothetical protein